jgi:hypothetical protein
VVCRRIPQVVAILEAGQPLPFRVKAANLDLPELQGEPVDIAKEKCRLASQQVIVESTSTAYIFLGKVTVLKMQGFLLTGSMGPFCPRVLKVAIACQREAGSRLCLLKWKLSCSSFEPVNLNVTCALCN